MKRELSKSRHAGIFMVALLSALLLVVSFQTVSATSGDYKYTVTDNQATITGYTGPDVDVVIPDTLGGYPVIAIGDRAFLESYLVTSITIPFGVTSIGDYAFQGCNSLARVEIPGSVTSIGDYVFYECHGWLTEINVDPSNSHYMSIAGNLFNKEGTILIQYAIAKPETTYTIPGTVTAIGPGAFQDCLNLTSVTIPNGVTSIGQSAFNGCIYLTSVTLSSSLSSIGQSAFANCSSLTSITFLGLTPPTTGLYWISQTNPDLRGHAYYGSGFPVPGEWFDGLLMGDYIPEYNYTIADGKATITKYIGDRRDVPIPDTLGGCPVVAIGIDAFRSLPVTSVTIPNSVTSIGGGAFYGCTSLSSVTIPNSVTSIRDWTFAYCTALTNVTIPNSVTSIGLNAFRGCTALESIAIPNSVTSIGNDAFYGCTSLTSVTIPNSVTSIGNEAFYFCTSLTSVTIPNSVTSIGRGAFSGCTSLSSVTIPNSVTSIRNFTFANCTALESINIPDSIASIGDGAFYGCSKLASIHFLGNQPSVGNNWIGGTPSNIRGHAFYSSDFPAPGNDFHGLTMGSYLANVTFSQTGIDPDNGGIVLTVNGTTYGASELPVTFTCYSGDTVEFSWSEVVGIDSGSRYRWYSGEGLSDSRSGTITVPDAGGLVSASYEIEYAVTLSANPAKGGSVGGRGHYTEGTKVTVTATANKGYRFVNWTEGGVDVSDEAIYTFDMGTESRSLVANFTRESAPVTYTVTVAANPRQGGSVSGGGTYSTFDSVTVTATAKKGYSFVNWTEGEVEFSDAASYTFEMGTESRSLVANFTRESEPATYTVTVAANPRQGGSVSGGGTYSTFDSVTVTATAKKGYSFVNWTEGEVEFSDAASYTFEMGTESRSLVANFQRIR